MDIVTSPKCFLLSCQLKNMIYHSRTVSTFNLVKSRPLLTTCSIHLYDQLIIKQYSYSYSMRIALNYSRSCINAGSSLVARARIQQCYNIIKYILQCFTHHQLPSEFIASIRHYKQHIHKSSANTCLSHLAAWLKITEKINLWAIT